MNTSLRPPRGWQPPHCPNPNCSHHKDPGPDWRWKRIGFYRRQCAPHRIQRFTCRCCGRAFSTQTFSTTYWQKRPDLDARILGKTVGCMANRQIARDLNVSPETVDRRIARLGRHCLLFHWRLLEHWPRPAEIVVDGFESFEWSQYYPFHHHLAVQKGTDFFIYFTDSELRRKGRMTAHQRARREELERTLGRPDPKAIEKDMRELLRVSLAGRTRARVYSDDHPAYRRSIRGLDAVVDHRVTPGKQHRDRNNALWEINLLDLLIRHGSANHKRETIAWSKRRQASAERLAIFLVSRNYLNRRREKDRHSPTPAMAAGIVDHRVDARELLGERIFPSHVQLPERWRAYYRREVSTRKLPRERKHDQKLAV